MAVSTLPAYKAALRDNLQGRSGLDGVSVHWGFPADKKLLGRESVVLGNAEGPEEAAALGNRRRREDYELGVVVTVARPGDDPEACDKRALELVEEVRDEVRDDPTQGVGDVLVSQVSGFDLRSYRGKSERFADCRLTLKIESRI